MKILAPAKINLTLAIQNKRKDGFHDLYTVFERIGIFDTIELLSETTGIRIVTDSADIPSGPENIVYRAAELLKKTCGISRGVTIRIRKKIPVGAGMGGGSSDGAAVLIGLNRLWKLGLSKDRLIALGAKIGSDIPFFILERPFAVGKGRGEVLKPIDTKVKLWHCIVKPPFSISTKKAYAELDKKRKSRHGRVPLTPPPADAKILPSLLQKGRPVGNRLFNDLELVAGKWVTEISNLKQRLIKLGAKVSLMSGSGSAVFGIFRSKKEAETAARSMRKDKRLKVFVVETY